MIYINFWKRAFALILDLCVILILMCACAISLQGHNFGWKPMAGVFIFIVLYFALLEASPLQATLGKFITGIKVTDIEGYRLSLVKSLIRSFIKTAAVLPLIMYLFIQLPTKIILPVLGYFPLLSFFYILLIPIVFTFFICLGTKRKQNLYDFAAGSVVIYNQIYDLSLIDDEAYAKNFELFKKRKNSAHPALIAVVILFMVSLPNIPLVKIFTTDISSPISDLPQPERRIITWEQSNFEDIRLKITAPGKFARKDEQHMIRYLSSQNSGKTYVYYLKNRNDEWVQSLNEWVDKQARRSGFKEVQQTEEPVTISGLQGRKITFTSTEKNSFYDFNCILLVLNKNEQEVYVVIALSTAKVFAKNITNKIISSIEITN